MTNDLLKWILRDWVQRVIADFDKAGVAPLPWRVAQTVAEVGRLLAKLEPDKSEVDQKPESIRETEG